MTDTTDTDHRAGALATPAPRPPAEQLLDPATGAVTVGVRADGTPARLPLWNRHGAVHTHISARAGCGASTLIDHLLVAEHAGDLTQSWVADPNGQRPSHQLAARTATGPAEILALLRDAVDLLRERSRDTAALADGDLGVYAPTPQRPLITLTLGDWPHLSTRDDLVLLAKEIALTGRRVGLSLRVETWAVRFQPSLPLMTTALRNAHQVVLTDHRTPGAGALAEHPHAPAHPFRTFAPAEQ
uniref:hypothetical protein n=1 Tax=Kitasatospora indigofera TaxID=67307 RepID=UPI002F906840